MIEIIDSALQDLELLKNKLETLRTYVTHQPDETADRPLKDGKGKLTDYGVRMLREWVDAGYTPSSIARALDISPSAVIYQRNAYIAERANTESK